MSEIIALLFVLGLIRYIFEEFIPNILGDIEAIISWCKKWRK